MGRRVAWAVFGATIALGLAGFGLALASQPDLGTLVAHFSLSQLAIVLSFRTAVPRDRAGAGWPDAGSRQSSR